MKKTVRKPARKAPAKKKLARKAPAKQKRAVKKVARKRTPAKKPSRPNKQKDFLAAYAACGCIRYAARNAKRSRSAHYKWMQDAAYAEAFAEAREEACEALESEARRRAVAGVRKPVYYQGDVVGMVREYSDTLLIFLMKAAMPEKYRDNVKTEDTGSAELLKRLAAGRARVAEAREEAGK